MDKYRGITSLPVLESKIKHLLGRLAGNKSAGSYQTQEELVRAYSDICNILLRGASERIYELPRVSAGAPVNEVDINLYLAGVFSEIIYMLDAVKNTASLAEENFNFAVALVRNLQAGTKYCRQQLSTFALYATQFGDILHFGETFSNETNIDRGSSLLGQQECFIDSAEGTVSLPRLEQDDEWTIKEILIGDNSNGVLGSNTEVGTPVRGSVNAMFDGNVDTWTEYERVTDNEDGTGLKLELKILLNEIQPVNGIKIHPIFLGARTPFSIAAIDVSSDGRSWVSLKNDVRVAEFLDEDPESRYHLSPHSSRFAGEFNITFAPRFVKFIRLLIKQSSAYPIFDVYGVRLLRYAIAIKEIEIYGHRYATTGELISKPITFTRDIAALGLNSLIDPPLLSSEVGGAEYFVSYDDGASWNQLSALDESSTTVPEVLYPPEATSSIRYKLHLFKDESVFSQQQDDASAVSFNERFGWSTRRPFTLNLLHKPIANSIVVCDPGVATRGKVYPKIPLGNGVPSSLVQDSTSSDYYRHGNTQLRLKLPLTEIIDPDTVHIYVNNVRWTKKPTVDDFTNEWTQQYVIERDSDNESWEVVFGNNEATTPLGKIPSSSDEVSLFLNEEEGVVEGLASPYKLKLDYPSDGIKENTRIRFHGGVYYAKPQTLPAGVKKFSLLDKNILINTLWRGTTYNFHIRIRNSTGIVAHAVSNSFPVATGVFQNYKTFINGDAELEVDGDWSVDAKNGILYSFTATDSDKEYTINYHWAKIKDLKLEDWDFVDGSLEEINIYDTGYFTQDGEKNLSSASAGDKSIAITINSDPIIGIVAKSLRVQDGELGGYRAFEVPFIDGITEFLGRAKLQDETIPSVVSDSTSIAKFRVTHWQNLVPTASAHFNDVDEVNFIIEKGNLASLTTEGDYFFDVNGDESSGKGYIYVHLGGVGVTLPTGYTISYQYIDLSSAERMKGSYSIDPKNGILYFAEALTSSDLLKSITFKYTPYRIAYNISRKLENAVDYQADINNRTIRILAGTSGARERIISVGYKYQPEELQTLDLAPYFSPLVRALDIRVS